MIAKRFLTSKQEGLVLINMKSVRITRRRHGEAINISFGDWNVNVECADAFRKQDTVWSLLAIFVASIRVIGIWGFRKEKGSK